MLPARHDGGVDRPGLAKFLRLRRQAIRPDEVGLPAGPRRRTPGLRREEVAHLTGMSVDYYNRLEQARAPQPSLQILRPLARSLRLSDDERDHLFRLAGHTPPERSGRSSHVRPALLHVLDRLDDCAAFVADDLDVVLAQNRLARLLMGEPTGNIGWQASTTWTWFTRPQRRARIPDEDHDHHSRVRAADLRATWSRRRGEPEVENLVTHLLAASPEFARLWAEHEVAVRRNDTKRFLHPAGRRTASRLRSARDLGRRPAPGHPQRPTRHRGRRPAAAHRGARRRTNPAADPTITGNHATGSPGARRP